VVVLVVVVLLLRLVLVANPEGWKDGSKSSDRGHVQSEPMGDGL